MYPHPQTGIEEYTREKRGWIRDMGKTEKICVPPPHTPIIEIIILSSCHSF